MIDYRHWRSGFIGNFLILSYLIAHALHAQPTYTQISDTVYTPVSGLNFTGQLQISNQVMEGTSASTIGQWLTSIPIVNGALSVALVPNDTVQPTGTVYVFKFTPAIGKGAAWTQYCSVPTSGSPVKLGTICALTAPPVPVPSAPVVISTNVGTGADTSEDTLMTYTLPGGRLNAGAYLKITAAFTVSGNPSNAALYFGATQVCSTGIPGVGVFTAVIVGLSATSQKVTCTSVTSATNSFITVIYTTPAESAASGVLIKATGTNANAFANSVVQRLMIIEPGNF